MTGLGTTTSRVEARLRAAVDRGDVPHLVAVAADAGGTICEVAASAEGMGVPHPDTLYRIASMTKVVCTVAALRLRDRGELNVDAPVDEYCPTFADVPVLTGFDGELPRYRPPVTRATVRQLLTHTSGLAYAFWDEALHRWQMTAPGRPLPDSLQGVFAAPLIADPGTRFSYGTSTDWLGRVLEVAGGCSLDVLLEAEVLGPLSMLSTGFRVTDDDRARLVPVCRKDDTGRWRATGLDWERTPQYWPGGHGLYSTPHDFLRFQRMLLGGGTLDGVTILGADTVAEMFRPQLGGLRIPPLIATAEPETSCDFRPGPSATWGWGLLLNTDTRSGLRAAGSGSWAGVFNTYFWVDPTTGVTGALYSQYAPFLDAGVLRALDDFERCIYRS